MSKEQSNIIEYLVCVIGAFARQFSLTNASAYRYLRQYKGLDFLTKHYNIEHTQSIEDAVEDITIICNRHGGALVMSTQEEQDKQFQIECLTNELVSMLIEERGLTMEQAMDIVYSSHTFEKVERTSTGLYYQRAVYVMDMLREELEAA